MNLPRESTTLVLLPPVGLDARSWDALELPDVAVAAHDYPGHGGRARAGGTPTLTALADDVAALHPGALDLVGVSLGGMVAMHLALGNPGRVRSLLLACTGATVDRRAIERRAVEAEELGMQGVLDTTLERWFTKRVLARRPEHPGVAYARSTLLALDPRDFANAWRAIAQHDVRDRLDRIRVPTTCLGGSDDVSSPPERMRDLASRVPEARLILHEGPHMLQLEQPAAFSRAIDEHLDRVGRD